VHKLTIGDLTTTQDFFGELGWKDVELGRVKLEKGKTRLIVEATGSNPQAEARRMFGLDYLQLVRD